MQSTSLKITTATKDDIDGIIDLRDKNLATKTDSGLLLWAPTKEEYLNHLDFKRTIILKDQHNNLFGYVLTFSLEQMAYIQHKKPSTSFIGEIYIQNRPLKHFKGSSGQICVDQSYRGQGWAEKMYKALKKHCQSHYDFRIFETYSDNPISHHFHHHTLNMKPVYTFPYQGKKEIKGYIHLMWF
ncbi:GNAT family N-acetyltransferase [Magnetococcales bacterium HHB-1]